MGFFTKERTLTEMVYGSALWVLLFVVYMVSVVFYLRARHLPVIANRNPYVVLCTLGSMWASAIMYQTFDWIDGNLLCIDPYK
jgi:hypothetical protein